MTLNLMPFIQLREFNNNGQLLAGGKMYFYAAGTNIPVDTYQDSEGTIANTNPVILDGSGSAKIFLKNQKYHVQIFDQYDVLIHDIDGIGSGGSESDTGTFIILDNYQSLRNLGSDYDLVYILGRESVADGGQGLFQYDSTLSLSDDDGIVLVRESTSSYKRQLTDFISPIWYGCVYNSAVDNSALLLSSLNASIQYNLPVLISDSLFLGSDISIKSGSSIRLDGKITASSLVIVRFLEGSKLISGSVGCFGSNIQPVFEKSIIDELKISWFSSDFSQLTSATSYDYRLIIDVDVDISSDVNIDKNYEVDFIGGSVINVDNVYNINIENVIYKGVGQIINYKDLSYISSIKVGNSYSYLEWFGGGVNVDNKIALTAGLRHGAIYLISESDEHYKINTSGVYNSNGSNVVLKGNYIPNNNSASDLVPSSIYLGTGVTISANNLVLDGVKIFGAGVINSKETTIKDTIIAESITTTTTTTSNITDTLFYQGSYIAVGSSGKVVYSKDSINWSSTSAFTPNQINTVTRNQKYWVVGGIGGSLFTSIDGVTWTARSFGGSNTVTKLKYINNLFVGTCSTGLIIYSYDGISWSSTQTNYSGHFRSVTYFNGLYIVVGTNGTIYTSPDLLTWTSIVVTGLSTTVLYDIDTNGTIATIVGANGAILVSNNGSTWRSRVGITTKTLMSVKYYSKTKKWVSTGYASILTSDDTISWFSANIDSQDTNSYIFDSTFNNGIYVFVLANGYTYKTYDIKTFERYYTNSSYDLNSIASSSSKFIATTEDGKIQESYDSYNWTLQTTTTATSIKRAKNLGNLYFVLGSSGFLAYSYDATTWTTKSISTTATLQDIQVNSDESLYVVVGSSGKIFTCVDFTITTPIVNERTSNTSYDLNAIVYSSAAPINQKYIAVGNSGISVYSSDAITWNVNNYSTNGLITSGSLYIMFGDSGIVLTSYDMKNWVKRTSNTTLNLTVGSVGNGKIVLGGQNGVIITSTDGVTWTTRSSGVSTTFNEMIYTSAFFVAGSIGTLRTSTDGITWSSSYTSATSYDFNSVKYINGLYTVVGSDGLILTSPNLSTWTRRTSNISATSLNDSAYGSGNMVVVGDNGVVLYSPDASNWVVGINSNSNNINKVVYTSFGFVAICDGGKVLLSSNGKFWNSVSDVPSSNNLNYITTINNTQYIAGSNFTLLSSSDNSIWTGLLENPTSNINSIVYNNSYMLTCDNLVYTSFDGLAWTKQDNAKTNYNKVVYLNNQYILFGTSLYNSTSGDGWTKSNITGNMNSVAYGNLDGSDYWVFGMDSGKINSLSTLSGIYTSATKVSVYNSILETKIINTLPGTISNSNIYSLSYIGLTTDSTFYDFDGVLSDTVSRSTLSTNSSIGVSTELTIVDSKIIQNKDGYDLFSVGSSVSGLNINNTIINASNSMLLYSENTNLKVNINGGILYNGSNISLSNGYAKLFLNNVFDESDNLINNVSSYSNNGNTLDTTLYGSTKNITTSLSGWYHSQKSNLSSDGEKIIVTSAILLSTEVMNSNTLRYRFGDYALRFIKNFGGRIRTTITLPTGYDKDKQAKIKLASTLYIPTYSNTIKHYTSFVAIGYNNDEYRVGKYVKVGSTKDGANIITNTNVWSGRANLITGEHTSDLGWTSNYSLNIEDSYGDYSFVAPVSSYTDDGTKYYSDYIFGSDYYSAAQGTLVGDNTFEAYIILNSIDENVTIPQGTTIKIELLPVLPKTKSIYNSFFNTPTTTIDSLNGLEKVYINFEDNSSNVLRCTIKKNSGSKTYDEQNYLSLTTYPLSSTGTSIQYYVPNSYKWTIGKMRFLQQFEPEKLLTGFIAIKNIELKLENLKPNPNYAQIFGVGSTASGVSDLVGNGRWNSASSIHTTVSPIQFYMLTDGHYLDTNDTKYRIMSKIEMKQYYQS